MVVVVLVLVVVVDEHQEQQQKQPMEREGAPGSVILILEKRVRSSHRVLLRLVAATSF